MTDYNLTVSVNHEGIPPLLDVVQGDSGRNIVVTIADMDISDCSARVYVVKPSGLDVYNNAAVVGDTVIVELTVQMLAEAGNSKMQVMLYGADGERVTTFTIWLNVEKSLQDNGRINSSTEYKTLDELIGNAGAAIEDSIAATDEANKAADSANSAASSANGAASSATAAASNANTAADEANTATTAANNAAQSASDAARAANEAATAITYPVPVTGGGTGATNYKQALSNLHAAETTTEALTYYVDATSGNDDNDGLTEGTAFKTIQHAIDILPKVIFHQIIINCAEGTYEEDLIIEEFKGNGWLAIYGNNQDCSRHFINSLYCKNCYCYLIFQGWTVTKSQQIELTYYASIIANHCTECNFYELDFPKKDTSLQNGKLGSAIAIRNSSTASLGNISAYEQEYAILCIGASECQLGMISGSGNEFGYYAGNESYIIAQNTLTTDFATTKYQKITGGLVYAAGVLVT